MIGCDSNLSQECKIGFYSVLNLPEYILYWYKLSRAEENLDFGGYFDVFFL